MKGKPAEWLHKYGAKMHFNTIRIQESELVNLNQIGSESDDSEIDQVQERSGDMIDEIEEESSNHNIVSFFNFQPFIIY